MTGWLGGRFVLLFLLRLPHNHHQRPTIRITHCDSSSDENVARSSTPSCGPVLVRPLNSDLDLDRQAVDFNDHRSVGLFEITIRNQWQSRPHKASPIRFRSTWKDPFWLDWTERRETNWRSYSDKVLNSFNWVAWILQFTAFYCQ